MRRPNDGAPVNRHLATVSDFSPDPRGTGLFQGLSGVLQAGISGHTGEVYTGDRGAGVKSFNGDLGKDLQRFTGAAALALYGAAKPIHDRSGKIASGLAEGALNDPTLRIFAARARRQAAWS